MPNPNPGESKDKYISRYMASPEANSSFPDAKQRYAVAQSKWSQHHKSFEKIFDITKVDTEERKVFGIFSMTKMNDTLLVDSDGDTIETHEIEKAAYEFNLNSRAAGRSHGKTVGIGRLIESFVVTKSKMDMIQAALVKAGVKDSVLQPNAEFWFGGFQIDDQVTWDLIKSGDFTSFSIGGFADRQTE